MTFTQLNTGWNADPNAPEVSLSVKNQTVTLEFYLNNLAFGNVLEGDKGRLTFLHCHKYSFNGMNDEGYYMGQYRYKYTELPWGEFYRLFTDWQTDFPKFQKVLSKHPDTTKQKHYIIFFRDNTFECVAEDYIFEHIKISK